MRLHLTSRFADAIRTRIEAICLRPPRYENSYYGPLDKIINIIFSDPKFLNKPQALLRSEAEAEVSGLTISVTSGEYGDGIIDCGDGNGGGGPTGDFAVVRWDTSEGRGKWLNLGTY
ncbi:hypothetical protein HGRIS_001515 [Hohenbuehelia grisea]|uniref:Uncharacterized protein n=1 Tax=Hohenbuehelia grisea TaxID=104357 RepID=A0ABR3JQV7_9AGAR